MKIIEFNVLVHSCRLPTDILVRKSLKPGERYRAMEGSDDYRQIPAKCSCRRKVTMADAQDLTDLGEAEQIYRIKKGLIETDIKAIWMAQGSKVPRVDMITKADIQRAYIDEREDAIAYIEELHQMYMENRAKLIVPFREDPTQGRLLFPFRPDERTFGGY